MMRVFRLCRKEYTHALNGRGAAMSNNRWNSKGTALVYTAESRALALAELAVHLSLPILPKDYAMVEIEVPDDLQVFTLRPDQLPRNWNIFPHVASTQQIGDAFVRNSEHLLMKVPSAVVHGDHNYLINPQHDLYERIQIIDVRDFPIDGRLLM